MKTNNFRLLILSFLFFASFSLDSSAQSVDREIGLRMSGLDNYNFIYKKATSENKYLRIRAGAFNAQLNSNNDAFNLAFNLALGMENRKAIDDKLSFIAGIEPFLGISYRVEDNDTSIRLNPALGYVMGFHLNVSKHLGLAIETIPSINASISDGNDSDFEVNNIGIGFNSNAVALNVVYRFNK